MCVLNMQEFVLGEVQKHPNAAPKDILEMCFCVAYASAHIPKDRTEAKTRLLAEFARTQATGVALFENFSNTCVRASVSAWKDRGLPAQWLFELSLLAAEQAKHDPEALLKELIGCVSRLAGAGLLPFGAQAWLECVGAGLKNGHMAQRHSDKHKNNTTPAYGLIKAEHICVLAVLERAAALSPSQTPHVLAIDGRAASGKTSTANLLKQILKASVIRMDDFFLPGDLRTPERLDESGGNVHYERFIAEVLPFLKTGTGFDYRVFDCKAMDYGQTRRIKPSDWMIVEGAYSCHPIFGDYADLRVFCDVEPNLQMQRIIERNGNDAAKMFFERWIPMEERYLKTERVRKRADVVIRAPKAAGESF